MNSIKIFTPLGRRCKLHGAIHPHRVDVMVASTPAPHPSLGLHSFFFPRAHRGLHAHVGVLAHAGAGCTAGKSCGLIRHSVP